MASEDSDYEGRIEEFVPYQAVLLEDPSVSFDFLARYSILHKRNHAIGFPIGNFICVNKIINPGEHIVSSMVVGKALVFQYGFVCCKLFTHKRV